jgi:hypothetical protein
MRSIKSERSKRSRRQTKSPRVKRAMRATSRTTKVARARAHGKHAAVPPAPQAQPAPQRSAILGYAATVFVMSAMMVVLLLLARPSFEAASISAVARAPLHDVVLPPVPAAPAARTSAPANALPVPASVPVVPRRPVVVEKAPEADVAPKVLASTSPAVLPTVAPTVTALSLVEPPVPAEVALVTITGCLERNDGTYRLKDTTGAEAPKSRSWRTGFLTRRSATIDLEAASGISLAPHVGQRLALTGTLEEHELRVRSVQTVSASCKG